MDEEQTDRSQSPSHDVGTRKGEELGAGDSEARREGAGTNPAGRPTGTSTARMATGVNPEDENPINPDSPELPPA